MTTIKSIACHVRLRPPSEKDGKIDQEAIKIEGDKISALNKDGDKRYHFKLDKCHDTESSQQEVFDCVKPLVEQAYKGINTTIFAYGVTGAGKTHTMQGTKVEPGIIPRTVEAIFQQRSILRKSTLNVSFSYVEILKDEVYDLLGDRSMPKKRDIRMSGEGQNIVADLVRQHINSIDEFSEVYDAAAKTRKTASTKLNSSSSRSHAILTLHIEIIDNSDPMHSRIGKICLTDLAGSENNNLTGNDKERMRESSAINTSLTTLGKVVDALNLNAQKGHTESGGVFVPYRESKLTRLLQDALGGTSQGLLICCLAPGETFARDTINTLQFAKKSKAVENRLTVPEYSSRQASAPLPRLSKPINPDATFKVHSEPLPSGAIRSIPGRMALATISANARPIRSTNNRMTRAEGDKENALKGMTDEQLDQRIQKVVSQQIAREKELCQALLPVDEQSPVPFVLDKDKNTDLMSTEEKENRARVIVSHARKAHYAGDLQQALSLYRKALEYAPTNHRLATRITELELSLEGILPPQRPYSNPSIRESKSGIKRSHAHMGSLAEMSYEESPLKKEKLR
ncbi:uncharacterized protein IL334_004053 [Kwoniella shivajii]|uniref:Kinesin motor domain-containing protein n=1 Tax=Kwoniella shivajii TaxID=564305 RepID=A0ABZ1CZ95_9TREE|nr:hypothetical protein IL334_004053 [Kwoniella shivajii]